MWGLGGGLGVLGTGIVGQWLYNWRKGAMPLYSGLSIMVARGAHPLAHQRAELRSCPCWACFVSLGWGSPVSPSWTLRQVSH